ncbi:MAG: class I SAM-dependent methyltransferase [Eubacteriales bacterium]|nr:class I SAM-dependent methyltransferase [Eubacteriales bacterium]
MNSKETDGADTRRETCLACGHRLPEETLLTISGMPASAQDIPLKEELLQDHGITLRLCKCPHCGLVQFDCQPVGYYRDVIRAVGLSETMRALRRSDYRYMIDTYGLSGAKFIECGCGRGEFMEVLKEFPAEIYATEANADFAKAAAALLGDGCHVMNCFPDDAAMKLPGAPFDCFFSFNFLEHQIDPSGMLGAMYANLRAGGYGLITVPSFEYILKAGRYYELIRDHIANYSLGTLTRLCEDCGFQVLEKGFIGIGDTLRVVVRKPEADSLQNAVHKACADIFRAFQAERKEPVPEDLPAADISVLAENYDSMREKMAEYMDRLQKAGLSLSLFGAGHQGFTIAATTALKDYAEYMMDSADFKQGRYAPASHIPIVSPDYFAAHPTDVIMITAPGYVKEITALLREKYREFPALKICSIEPESWVI